MIAGTPPKKLNARTWPSQKASVVFGGIADHEAGVRVRQIKKRRSGSCASTLPMMPMASPKLDSGMSRQGMLQHGSKHLLSPPTPAGDVILHNRVRPPCEAVLVPETLEDPLRRMLLFFGRDLSSRRIWSITAMNGIKLRLGRRLLRMQIPAAP